MPSFRIEPLTRAHVLEGFDCGQENLNRFLIRYALQNQQASASRTFVALSDEDLLGFYTLVVGEVRNEDAGERLRKGLARYPVPIMVIARLAVAIGWQHQGIGAGLLKDSLLRTLQAAEHAGIRAVMVHAKDETARAFYERFGFAPSASDPLHLYVLLKDIAQTVGRAK